MKQPSHLLPTSVIGSHGLPSWLWLAREGMAQGRFGATDVEETLQDATMMAIRDQVEAGVDIISDGEMRRVNFILGFFDRLAGLERLVQHGAVPKGASVLVPITGSGLKEPLLEG